MSKYETTLSTNGNTFKKKAEYYMSRGELEGSLINYLLAGNCYHTLIESSNGSSNGEWQKQLTLCMRYIVPLQEKLQQLKRDRGCPKKDEEDKISCTNMKLTDQKFCS